MSAGRASGTRVVSLADDPRLADRLPFGSGWPKFIFEDPVAKRLLPTVERLFADFNVVLVDDQDQIVAGGWGVPIPWSGEVGDLPDGWDGALELSVQGREQGADPNTLCAMATEVVATARGSGLSTAVLGELRRRARERGLPTMIAPARPTLKHRYPLVPIDRYARWTRADGTPFDPWIRTHWRLGARILATAPGAMRIVASVADWEEMTGMTFPESGEYVVPDALSPVRIDVEADRGTYVEPAIWMLHARVGTPRGPEGRAPRNVTRP